MKINKDRQSIKVFMHKSSYIDEGAKIGQGTKVWHFSHIQSGAVVGENCIIGQNVNIATGAIVGNGVKVQNNVSIYKGVVVLDDAFLGPSMTFTNVNNPRSFIERKDEFRKTIVGKGASIGANATIVCGNTIGDYAFIGAGSVVTKDVATYALVAGVPAKPIGWICKCGEKLDIPLSIPSLPDTKTICIFCKKSYRLNHFGQLNSMEE